MNRPRRQFSVFKFFAVTSAPVLLIVMAGAGYLYHHNSVRNLVELAETHNTALAEVLSKVLWPQVDAPLLTVPRPDGDALMSGAEIQALERALSPLTGTSNILKIKIYSPDGTTLYSSVNSEIGADRLEQSHGAGFLTAITEGRPASKLAYEQEFTAYSGAVFDRNVVETYIPIRLDTKIAGVLEIYSDVTEVKDRIDKSAALTVAGSMVGFLLLYGTLVLVVMRHAMAPLRLASRRAAQIGPRSPGVRLPTEGMAQEVMPLVEAINKAFERLDRALESQRQFTADAAHELLTPLAVVRAHLDSLADKETAGSLAQDIEVMSDIVTQLLELSEIDAFDVSQAEPVDIRGVCFDIVEQTAPLAFGNGKALALDESKAELWARCCPKGLARALRNLVENAIHHTAKGTTVEVRLGDDGAIRVVDHGPGIAPDDREIVFRRFWRGKRHEGPGAGLGLSIVKSFVDAHGGSVEINDTPGGGATFVLRLPLVPEPQSAAPR